MAASVAATSPRAEDKAPPWVLCDDERVDELTEAESCKILDGDDNRDNGDDGSKRRRSGAAPYLLFYVRQATTYADFFDNVLVLIKYDCALLKFDAVREQKQLSEKFKRNCDFANVEM